MTTYYQLTVAELMSSATNVYTFKDQESLIKKWASYIKCGRENVLSTFVYHLSINGCPAYCSNYGWTSRPENEKLIEQGIALKKEAMDLATSLIHEAKKRYLD